MAAKQVDIDGRKFNIGQAPANKQKTLLSMIGARIALNASAAGAEEIDTPLLVGALLAMPETEFDSVAEIVLFQTVENGGDKVIEIGDFQDCVTSYYRLVAAAIEVNLSDFFTYLGTESASRKQAEKSQ